jgi:hypothetical protein
MGPLRGTASRGLELTEAEQRRAERRAERERQQAQTVCVHLIMHSAHHLPQVVEDRHSEVMRVVLAMLK